MSDPCGDLFSDALTDPLISVSLTDLDFPTLSDIAYTDCECLEAK